MELKQLKYFVTVAEEGSISAAAKKLYLTQPPMSTAMHLLEQECGCILFERGSRHIRLTEAGKLLYDRACAMLRMADTARDELRNLSDGAAGTLRIGVISSAEAALADWCGSFCLRYPQVRFSLNEANTYLTLEHLQAGVIDLAVVRTPFPAEGLDCRYLPAEAMLAVGRPSFFGNADAGARVPLSCLAGKPLILYRRWEDILVRAFAAEQLTPTVLCENDDARTTAQWAEAGLGVGILPASGAEFLKSKSVAVHEIACAELQTAIALVTRPGACHPAAAEAFLSHVLRMAEV